MAGGLIALGVRPGDRVAMVHPTGAEFFDAFFGALLAGAVATPLYPPVRLGRIDEYVDDTATMLREAGARCVVLDRRARRVFGGILDRARPPLGGLTLSDLPAGRSTAIAPPADALGLVQFSSGSTRRPKPVALTHAALVAQARALNALWPDDRETRHTGVSWLPLYHDMGLIGCVIPALERGSTITLIGPEAFVARPAIWLRTLSRYRATISPAPNFAFAFARERIRDEELEGVDLSSWRVAPDGAEPVSADVIRAFVRRFRRWGLRPETVTPVYGLSEAALAVTFSPPDVPFVSRRFDRQRLAARGEAVPAEDGVELVSVGRPLPGFAVRIVDRRRTPLGPGRVGTIEVRGPSLMREYLGHAEDTARVLRDGWLDTGDLGFVHDGDLHVTGRSKDVVILRGRNHDPATFEEAAGRVRGVRTGRVVAVGVVPEGADGERLWLFVEPRRTARREVLERLPDACRRAVLETTAVAPDRVVVLRPGAIPRTSSGKVRRRETLRRYLGGTLVAPGFSARLRLAREVVRSWIPDGAGPPGPS